MGKIKIAFFDAKDYDKQSFVLANENEEFDITYYEARLSSANTMVRKVTLVRP